jgi:protein KRI1
MSSAAASSSKPSKPTRRSKKAAPVSESSGSDTDSSEDVTEDEDGVDLTPALDAAILRTLAKIRNKRGVYEGENVLEDELKEAEEKVISAGIKAMPNRKEEIKVGNAELTTRVSWLMAEIHSCGSSSSCPPQRNSRRRRRRRTRTSNTRRIAV